MTQEAIDACVKLSDRYMTDRLLPDKAIDVMDEVGARVHLKNINVPQNILELEKKIEDIKQEKNKVVKSQRFEEAAALRDTRKTPGRRTGKSKERMGRRSQDTNATRYTKKHIAEVVSMMTGIPVMRMVEAESAEAAPHG